MSTRTNRSSTTALLVGQGVVIISRSGSDCELRGPGIALYHSSATMTLVPSNNDVEEMTFQTASFQQKLEISTEKSNLRASSKVATRLLLATILFLLLGNHTKNLLTVIIVESVPDMSNTKRFAKRAGRNVDQVPKGMTPCLLEAISRAVNSTVSPGTIVDLIGYTETSCFGGAGKNDVTLSFEKGGERNLTVYGSTWARHEQASLIAAANELGITFEEAHATLEENDPEATKWSVAFTHGIS